MSEPSAWASARASREGKENPTASVLLGHAAEIFARKGYAGTTIEDITRRAGLSRAVFYLYFSSKQDVFSSVAAQVLHEFLAAHDLPESVNADPVLLGREASRAFLGAYTRHLDLLTVIEHQALADPAIEAIWREIQERPRRRMVRYVRRLMAEGDADPAAEPDLIAEAVLGMFERFARHRITDPDRLNETAETLNAMYLRLLGIERKVRG